MGRVARTVIPLFVALTMCSAAAVAQDWSQPWADPMDRPPRVDISASAGFVMPTRWSDIVLLGSASPVTGVLQQVLTPDVHVAPNSTVDVGATYWRSRYGFRARAGFSHSSLKITSAPVAGTTSSAGVSADVTAVGVDTWLYDVGGAIGLVEYAPTRRVWPYGFIGFGGITYHLKQTIAPPLTFVDRGPSLPTARNDRTIVSSDGRQFLITTHSLSTETTFAVNVGLGSDFRIPLGRGGVGVRLEIADYLASSPLTFRVEELSSFGVLPSDTGVRRRLVHHLSATAGLVVHVGR
jgi:hypothetical protein